MVQGFCCREGGWWTQAIYVFEVEESSFGDAIEYNLGKYAYMFYASLYGLMANCDRCTSQIRFYLYNANSQQNFSHDT